MLKYLGIDPCFYCSGLYSLLLPFSWWKMGIWKGMLPIYHHFASIIISLPCCQVNIQNIFLLVIVVRSSLIFEMVLIDNSYLCGYVHVGAGWFHSYYESYCQSLCLQWVQSWLNNVLVLFQNMIFIGFQRLLQLWIEIYWIVVLSVDFIKLSIL